MKDFAMQVAELVFAHIVSLLVIGVVGGFVLTKLWQPAKRYWGARRWFNRAVSVGIRNFFPSRESYSVDRTLAFSDYLSSAERSLRYFGHWLAFTIEQHHTLRTLCNMAESGRGVHLVLLDPSLPEDILETYARYLGEDSASLRDEIKSSWGKVREARSSLSARGRDFLTLRRHIEFIPYSAFWFDRDQNEPHILIDMKLYGASRKDAYGIELHPVEQTSSRYPSLYERYAVSLGKLESRSIADA
jgi:hypothetical protein